MTLRRRTRFPATKARTLLGLCAALALFLAIAAMASHSTLRAERIPQCATDLSRWLEPLNVPGLAAAIIKDGRIACTAVAGTANFEEGRPVSRDTLFLVASVSKTITATALMQLYEQGKFEMDDDVNDYLPFEIRIPAAPEAPITFRQLLTHTSSIRDNPAYINCAGRCEYGSPLSPFITRDADSPIPLAEFTRGYLARDGDYYDGAKNFDDGEPGTINRYSNMGIVVAGYLVEAISGMPFDAYCRKHIFAPLKMNKTSWRLARTDRSLLAMPYDRTPKGFAPYGHFGEPDYPDGMVRTSVVELAHFLVAYMDGGSYGEQRILKTGTVNKMLRRNTPLDRSQGLVWFRDVIDDRTVWGHDGSDNGASARMWFDPERRTGVIMMANGVWDDEGPLFAELFDEADDY